MKNKRVKTRRKKGPGDVPPSTSLPPLVEGQLRCFLRVTVSRVVWTVARPPQTTLVRLRWWGESTPGTLFRPRDGARAAQVDVRSTAHFPIRCGPNQLASYLTDMGSLVLEILTKPDRLPMARAEVTGIARLSLSQSISGFYAVVSPTSEKMGELQVALALEPPSETFDGSSSVPTTDVSTGPGLGSASGQVPEPRRPSGNVGKELVGRSSANAPRGKDHLYFQDARTEEHVGTQGPVGGPHLASEGGHGSASVPPIQGHTTDDLLSALVERSSKLRDTMVVSALHSDLESEVALRGGAGPASPTHPLPSSGTPGRPLTLELSPVGPADVENRAVELLLGSVDESAFHVWDGDVSPPASLSGSACDSELNDPQYDHSLLENLFYTAVSLGSSSNEECEEDEGLQMKKANRSPEKQQPDVLEELNHERTSEIYRIRLARVIIHSLSLPPDSPALPNKTSGRGRAPRPLSSCKSSYFVEYLLPVASSRPKSGLAGSADVTRVASSRLTAGVVRFLHRSVFPVQFSPTALDQWWRSELTFKIYSRKSFQKKPSLVGMATLPLRSVLQSEQLGLSVSLPVRDLDGTAAGQDLGSLKVSVQLAPDSQGFSTKKNPPTGSCTIRLPEDGSPTRAQEFCQHRDGRDADRTVGGTPGVTLSSQYASPGTSLRNVPVPVEEGAGPEVPLHVLLMVSDGKDLSGGTAPPPSVYLSCKLFGSEETTRSLVTWGQATLNFNFIQVAPLTLTPRLLERMRNNVMVVEVWRMPGASVDDQLLGLVKLPLHQFYMSFREARISQQLLRARYPVVAVDGYMPVIDVFSGSSRGSLRVLLAMGLSQQVAALQRTRGEELDAVTHMPRPLHQLDSRPQSRAKVGVSPAETLTEHVFIVRVERLRGLVPLQATVWGEADCYVQYGFPGQDRDPAGGDPGVIESTVSLLKSRTATTLCVPDPVFGHSESHVLLAPADVPVQRLLLSALSTQGSGGGGVRFEVWCRFYYPNVRDQLVAKGVLPLSKLCAMVTMQGQQRPGTQEFSLPLVPHSDGVTGHQAPPSGMLDVAVEYQQRPQWAEVVRGGALAARSVTLAVEVRRAAGLQAAARALARTDPALRYYADVGVNSYVSIQPSFLPEVEGRATRAVGRTFCPEFGHHAEFCCGLLLRRDAGETLSLAELLHDAHVVLTVWNRDGRDSRSGENCSQTGRFTSKSRSRDTVLGTARLQLAELIRKRTGISGWFGLSLPDDVRPLAGVHSCGGGLEVSVAFAHPSDRERVMKAARALGWDAGDEEEDDGEDGGTGWTLSVSVPRVWLPVRCLLLPGHDAPRRSTCCYYRYKLYDRRAVCSALRHPAVEDSGDGVATVAFEGGQAARVRRTRPLLWYLREEKLEVQVWVAFGKEKRPRPRDSDRLVGSAFVDLSTMSGVTSQRASVSGVFPLFRRSAPDLSGAAVRVHVAMAPSSPTPNEEQGWHMPREEEEEEDEEEDDDPAPAAPTLSPSHKQAEDKSATSTEPRPQQKSAELGEEDTFSATVTVDRAMHLSLRGCPLAQRTALEPCYSVSYVTADAAGLVTTSAVENSDCPIWQHHQECRLSKRLLTDPQQSLVFKIWHKGEMERVIGFASVDLSPLLSGFQAVCGWYNITDFSGQCQGQLKVSVLPLHGIMELRGQRWAEPRDAGKESSVQPLCYQTSALYASFPSHISRYAEQQISASPARWLLSDSRSSVDSVSLQDGGGERRTRPGTAGDAQTSSSALFSALRKNLNELDHIQRYFNQKLTTPRSGPGRDGRPQDQRPQDERLDYDTDAERLLLKSTQLVGVVNDLISGLNGCSVESCVSSDSAPGQLTPVDRSPSVEEEGTARVRLESDMDTGPPSPEDHDVPPSEVHTPPVSNLSLAEAEMVHDYSSTSSVENEGGDEDNLHVEVEEQEEDDEEFEETLIEPRPLNEVTSLTDRTSPWTSLLSEPELGSLETLEPEEEKTTVASPERADFLDLHLHEEEPALTGSCAEPDDEEPVIPGRNISSAVSRDSCVGDEDRNSLVPPGDGQRAAEENPESCHVVSGSERMDQEASDESFPVQLRPCRNPKLLPPPSAHGGVNEGVTDRARLRPFQQRRSQPETETSDSSAVLQQRGDQKKSQDLLVSLHARAVAGPSPLL
ncbi:C2 domain-containing protein 3 isoform X2 [Denticeps clupeoides]|uniref:C2 domain-containing protein 3 isoform X2 n=1 Tax=Denticeps clupeoides TaxID=299321 RepID=UPI0010A3238D|nr:C2 domain-containing protein 3 isoform X2 [Denticeps clupeoides]